MNYYDNEGLIRSKSTRRIFFLIAITVLFGVYTYTMLFLIRPQDPNLNTINRVANNERIDELERRLDEMILEIEKLEGGKKLIGQWIEQQKKYNEGRVKSK